VLTSRQITNKLLLVTVKTFAVGPLTSWRQTYFAWRH